MSLYDGYNDQPKDHSLVSGATNSYRPGTTSLRGGGISRGGVARGSGEENRPMTAVRAAGYTAMGQPSRGGRSTFDPMGGGNTGGRGPAPTLEKRSDNSPEDKCREMEKEVNALIEESAVLPSTRHG